MDAEVGPGEARMTWDSPVQFFFTILGFCVGLGNIWRFPYLCQQNGGGEIAIYLVILRNRTYDRIYNPCDAGRNIQSCCDMLRM